MGKARNSLNPGNQGIARTAHPRRAAAAAKNYRPNQQNHYHHHPQNYQPGPSVSHKQKFKGLKKCKKGQSQGGPSGRNFRKRNFPAVDHNWGTPIPQKFRALSPVTDENGAIMSKEEQEVFYRRKVDAFDLRIPTISNLDALPTKNILAIVAGLTEEEEPTPNTDPTMNDAITGMNGYSMDFVGSASNGYDMDTTSTPSTPRYNLRRKKSPKLPTIPLENILEEGEISGDDDIICISDSARKKKKKPQKRRNNKTKVAVPSPACIDLIELNSDDDNESVICLDDENSEKEFANLSITTERVQASSKKVIRSQNGNASRVIIESQSISSTKTTVTAQSETTTQCLAQNMGINRFVRHYRRALHPILPFALQDHLDSLSYHTAFVKRVTLRGPEFVGLPPHHIDFSKVFRVVSYNVLCQATLERTQYLYKNIEKHPEWFLWRNRWHLLSTELQMLTADIYCLQEVEHDKVATFYEPLMVQHKGWKSFYAWRGLPDNADGCAIFWNPVKFEKIEEIVVNLNHGVPNLDRPNVAQILQLQHRKTGIEIIIVNTHILFNPKRGDIKLYQLAVIFANLNKIRTKNQPIIFCGDFNLNPDSLLYNFIVDGELDCKKSLCYPSTMSGQKRQNSSSSFPLGCFTIPQVSGVSNNCAFICGNDCDMTGLQKMHHCFNFESVYGNATYDGDKVISTYHQDKGNPDFMFYSVKKKIHVDDNTEDVTENNLFLYRRLSLPGANALERFCDPFPNKFTGSDHIPLCAEFFLP